MAFTYAQYTKAFAKRRTGAAFKSIFRDCRLTQEGDDFVVSNLFRNKLYPLARINPQNIVTLLYDGDIDVTLCNRFDSIIGRPVGMNKRSFGNYRQHVRIYDYTTWTKSIPYAVGTMFDVSKHASPCLNPAPDVKLATDNAVVQQAKRELSTIRKLTKAMSRMGAFDTMAVQGPNGWEVQRTAKELRGLADINIADPVADDALALVAYGFAGCISPDRHVYDRDTGKYVARGTDEYTRMWVERAVNHGLELLRKNYYKKTNGYVEKVVD